MATNASSPIVPMFLVSWVQLLVPDKCFDEFFINFNFLHLPCLKVVVSKGLGYAIILGAVVVKMPQLIKMCKAKSGAGISLSSVTFELVAICSTVIYSIRHGFPFSSFGEGLFLAIQTGAIGALVLVFNDKSFQAVLFLLSFTVSCTALLMPWTPMSVLALLQTGNIFMVIASKLLQAVSNFRMGSTGQLSVVTVAMITLGSTARIFTSLQETGDLLLIITYAIATGFNILICLQMAYYWNVPVAHSPQRIDNVVRKKKL